jgi:hypothetical protein
MPRTPRIELRGLIGRSPEQLTLDEQQAAAGKFAAFEIYTPERTPLRRIEAIGQSIEECVRGLQARGLQPERFEFIRITQPY